MNILVSVRSCFPSCIWLALLELCHTKSGSCKKSEAVRRTTAAVSLVWFCSFCAHDVSSCSHCQSRERGHRVPALPVHPLKGEEHQRGWRQQVVGGTSRTVANNVKGEKCIVILVHQTATTLSAAKCSTCRLLIKMDFGLSPEPGTLN